VGEQRGAPLLREALRANQLGDAELLEAAVGAREQRLADVEAGEGVALVERDAAPAPGQRDRRGATGGATAGDGDVVGSGLAGSRLSGGRLQGGGQYTSAALDTLEDPILRAFAATAARRPLAPLVASPSRSWSAADLDGAAAALAGRLAAEGFGEGDAIGLAAAPGAAFAAGYLALRRRRAVPVLCDSARPTPDRLAALDRLGVVGFLAAADGWPASARAWTRPARARAGARRRPRLGRDQAHLGLDRRAARHRGRRRGAGGR